MESELSGIFRVKVVAKRRTVCMCSVMSLFQKHTYFLNQTVTLVFSLLNSTLV